MVVEGDDGGEGEEALADRREVWAPAGLVFAARPEDRCVHVAHSLGEGPAGIALSPINVTAPWRRMRASSSSATSFGAGNRDRAWCAVGREDRVQAKPPEEPPVTGALAIVRSVVAQMLRRDREGPPVRRNPHDCLSNAERYDFRVCDDPHIWVATV